MKPVWAMIAIAGSLVAGGAGGIVASTLFDDKTEAPRQVAVAAEAGPDDTLLETYQRGIEALRSDINRLQVQINSNDTGNLMHRLNELETRFKALESRPAMVHTVETAEDGTPAPSGAALRVTVDELVQESLRRAEEERSQQEQERRASAMTQMRERQKEQIVTRLVESLNLTTAQQGTIDAAIGSYLEQRADVWTRSAEARRNNVEFDATVEYQRIEQSVQAAIRSELLGGQLQTFNELVGDNGVHQLGGFAGRFGGAPGGMGGNRQGGRQAGNRRGNGE